MKTHHEHPQKPATLPSGPSHNKQTDWWKQRHPHTKPAASSVFVNTVKTGFWKTYNVRSSGKK